MAGAGKARAGACDQLRNLSSAAPRWWLAYRGVDLRWTGFRPCNSGGACDRSSPIFRNRSRTRDGLSVWNVRCAVFLLLGFYQSQPDIHSYSRVAAPASGWWHGYDFRPAGNLLGFGAPAATANALAKWWANTTRWWELAPALACTSYNRAIYRLYPSDHGSRGRVKSQRCLEFRLERVNSRHLLGLSS